jgi:hypothetical protein
MINTIKKIHHPPSPSSPFFRDPFSIKHCQNPSSPGSFLYHPFCPPASYFLDGLIPSAWAITTLTRRYSKSSGFLSQSLTIFFLLSFPP